MQAILTKYLGPTNTKGSRIKAWCEAGSITVPYDYAAADPHLVAFSALLAKLGWSHVEISGQGGIEGGSVFTLAYKDAQP